ncbi:response regulator [Leptolyngbya sp. FACHB-261]|uniref:response regulator n=1 Tax=Leptolyngbya sp. FACHB-261 TaxID=2692806 RepID=UPI0016832965|nr:response regulator [Leptolyngbya sp. FACHB-261]MBD2100576.1 response regulator [Leptolyngbya sp. FACHB-261]
MDLQRTSTCEQCIIGDQPLILSVDSQEDSRFLCNFVLSQLGCSYITAADGRSAFELSRLYQPALILTEIVLPDLSGFELVSLLKKNPYTASIPTIAVTATELMGGWRELLEAGFDGYLSKPYQLEALEALIQHFLPVLVTA